MAACSFDIFCRVVDNYGDIGVCWRLARQLARRPSGRVRLWVDDLASFARITPAVKPDQAGQTVDGVHILRWDEGAVAGSAPADVVIEAFACEIPADYIARMSGRQLWINLEYLSAEAWVESCHGLPSPQANGLRKFFFFPGFTPHTGGLLREPGLIGQRMAWQADPGAAIQLLQSLGVGPAWLERLRAGARLVYVYCYPRAPLPALFTALAGGGRDTLVLMPEGIWPEDPLRAASSASGRIQVHTHRFVDQEAFDRLLWSSDLNIVRGEDSLLRALWAGQPLIWQPYPQEDGAHLDKLDAWLERSPFPADIRQLMRAWSLGDERAATERLPTLLSDERLRTWRAQVEAWCAALRDQDDLATRLGEFCAKNGQTR
ncbi:elongation factor P maturation arginine rhamnosyltransferase EarP [Alcaligenaceae bacterium]|nr:elongation factor P maturation arginine rhamnosyltransferase EarP [Alcaligenaceae bacterium]